MLRAPTDVPEHRGSFGARVRELRLERGLSQEALMARTGLHRTYIGSVERGERNLSLDAIHAFAEGLGVDVAALFPPD